MANRRISFLVAVLAVVAGSVFPMAVEAQRPAAPPIDPARVAAAKDLFKATGQDAAFETVIDTMLKGLADQAARQRPAAADEIRAVFASMRQKFLAEKEAAIAMTAPLYAEKFTVEEMGEVAAFYRSPVGRKFVREQPEIMQRSMRLGMAWGERLGREAAEEARRELKKRGIDL